MRNPPDAPTKDQDEDHQSSYTEPRPEAPRERPRGIVHLSNFLLTNWAWLELVLSLRSANARCWITVYAFHSAQRPTVKSQQWFTRVAPIEPAQARDRVRVIKIIDAPLIKIIDGIFDLRSSRSTGGVVLLSVFFDQSRSAAFAAADRWPYQLSIHECRANATAKVDRGLI